MKRLLFLLILILPLQINVLFSQDPVDKLLQDIRVVSARSAVGSLGYEDIEGSPHYTDVFIKSIVYLKDGSTKPMPLRYDLFQDEMEFMRDGKIFWLIKQDVSYIEYGKEILICEPLPEEPGKSAYFFTQGGSKYALYTRKKMKFLPKAAPQPYTDAVPDRFEPDHDMYYLKQEDTPVKEIRSKKILIKILSENKPALEFIKRSKIKINNAQDLLKLVEFLNNQ